MELVYSLAQMGFTTDQQKRVQIVLDALAAKSKEYGCDDFFTVFNQENLNTIKFVTME